MLGARAVMIGRAYLWGLAAKRPGRRGNVLDILRGGIDPAVPGLGHSSVHELAPDDIVVPPDSLAHWVLSVRAPRLGNYQVAAAQGG